MSAQRPRYPLWVRGDLDGFFGLMVDNLVQVLLSIDLCKFMCGLPPMSSRPTSRRCASARSGSSSISFSAIDRRSPSTGNASPL